jgi:hypothetical protein
MIALLLLAAQDVVIERDVSVTTLDLLGRRGEIRRRERLCVRGADLAISDLTFGERLIVRGELRRVYRADPQAGTYWELSFEELGTLRQAALDELAGCRARVPGTSEEKELGALLEGLDRYDAEPKVELKSEGAKREILVNGDRVRLSAEVDPSIPSAGYFGALSALGAFHPAVADKLKELGGFPVKGTFRYALFLDRVIERVDASVVKPGPAPAGDFELPPNLKKVEPRGLWRDARAKPAKPPEVKKNFGEDDGDRKEREERNNP